MHCLDSSFLVDYLNQRGNTLGYLEAHPTATYYVPTLVLYELYAGALRSESPNETIATVANALDWVDIIGFSDPAAREAAHVNEELHARGTPINAVDMLIGGIAREMGATLVATDDDFETIPDLTVHVPGEMDLDE